MAEQSPIEQITKDPFAAIRIPEFRNLMLGRFTFIVSLRMMSTMLAWWVYELTNDPFAIGLVGLSEVIPAISMALYAGHVIDRSEKKRVLIRGVILYICAVSILILLSTDFTSDRLSNSWIAIFIYMVIFCTGIIRAFAGPTFSAMLANTVPRQYLQNATTWNQGSWLSGSVTGHALGGFLIAKVGTTGTLLFVYFLMAIALAILSQLHPKPPVPQQAEKKTWDSVTEGLRFVFRTKELLAAYSLDMFAVLFGGAVAMVPVYAKDILKVGPVGFGWLNAAIDIGSIFIIILLAFNPMKRSQGKKLMFAVAGFGVCIIVFALSKWFTLSFIALLVAGMVDGVSVVVRGTVMQLKTPDHMRGRVSSVGSMFINSSNELGQFESGMAARLMGVVPSVVFGGCMTLIVVIVTWIKAPALKDFEY
jgi:MFS family permease